MDKNYKDTKECPMCAETVKQKAKICRFCTHEFKFETEEINPPTMDSPESEPSANTKEIFYDVWIMSCPVAFHSNVAEVLMAECFFETWEESLEVVHAIPTKLFLGLMKEEAEHYQKLLVKAGAKVTIEESDMEVHATSIENEYLDQLDGKEPNADNYYEFISTENLPAEEDLVEEVKEDLVEEVKEDLLEEVKEDLVEEAIVDDKGWATFNEFTSTGDSPARNSPATIKYDVWITSAYNDKVCNEIIDITNWDAWVAGKFLLDLEDYGDAKKLVEDVDIDDAERIKNKLEEAGALITVKSHK